MEWPAKAQETKFGAIRSRGKRRTPSSWSQPKNRQKTAKKPPKPCQSANNGVFPFPTLDSGGMACKSPRNRVWCNSVNGYAQDSVVLEPAEKPTKNRQNRANLLIMVSSRFQRSIQVEWPAKAQETEFGAIRSRGKRKAASNWSQQKNRQNRANLLIMVSSHFQRSIQVEWPAKTQETEFGVIRSRGKRRTASSMSRPIKRQKCSREQNWGNLLILVFFRFQHPIPVEWPAKAQETEFGAIRSRGKRKAASSWSQPKNRQNRANLLIMVSSRFQRSIQVEWPAKARETEFGAIRSRGKRKAASSWSQPKNRQNRANLLIMVSSRFQRSIQVEWPAKAQETEFSAIRSKGKRRTASSLSRPKNRQKTPPKPCQSANNGVFPFPTLDSDGMACKNTGKVEWPAKTQETEFGVIRSRGKRRTASSMSRPKKRQKCSREQNWGNLLILVFFRFQHPIQVEWPAKAQETEFGAIRSRGKRKAASSWSQPKNRQNRANLLIMVSSRFQRSIQVEWPAKAQETEFGAIRSRGKRKAASSWSQPKNRQNRANLLIMVSSRFQRSIQVEWHAKAQETEFGAIRSRGKRKAASSWSQPKNRRNRANLLIMVSSRFQRSIQVEWPAKTQETEFGVIRSRGKRRTASSMSRPIKRQKCSREQNWGNLLILVFFRFQHPILVEWPAKAQETEFGVIRSRGKRRTASSMSRPIKRQKCSREQNWGNLLILVFFRFQHPILVEWPAKAQETKFGAIRSRGKRRTPSSWSQPKNRQKTAKKPPKPCQSANNGVFPFPTLDSGGMACKSPRNRVWCNSVNGYAQDSVVLEPAEKPPKNRQNRANLLIMVSSRFQRSIQVEWPAKAQETEFGAIRSRGKRKAASNWSQQKNRQNRANLLIMVSSHFQRSIQVEWPAKTQETEFGVIRSRGKRRTASSMSRPIKRQKCSREQNWGNLLILVFFRFQHPIPVEWPAKAQETEFGAIRSRGKRKAASSWSQPKNRQNRANLLIMVSSRFQRSIQVEWPAKARETEFGAIRSRGKRKAASSWSQPKNRRNRANLLIMVSSRFQRSIQVEWPAKTQETEFGVIRSRGKRRTASSMSRPIKRQKCSREQNWGNLLILV